MPHLWVAGRGAAPSELVERLFCARHSSLRNHCKEKPARRSRSVLAFRFAPTRRAIRKPPLWFLPPSNRGRFSFAAQPSDLFRRVGPLASGASDRACILNSAHRSSLAASRPLSISFERFKISIGRVQTVSEGN